MALLLDEPAWLPREVGVVRVTGQDRLHYLHQMLSQHVEQAAPGDVADFLLLDAKGVAQAAGRLVVHAEAVLLLVPPEVVSSLASTLASRTFLMDAAAADASADLALASARGPEPLAQPGARDEPMTAVPHGEGLVIRDRWGGLDLLGSPTWVRERAEGLGLPQADAEDWERWRILHGEVDWGHELATGRRPQELGLLPTHVHLRKGCYPGQESIAKMHNLGRPRRALHVVELDGPVSVHDPITAGSSTGQLTSVAPHGDGAVALALLPLDRQTGEVAGGGEVAVGPLPGRVRARVGAGLPQPGDPTVADQAAPTREGTRGS